MKNVMKKAWEIAKRGQEKFGGNVKEYFAEALKMAWAIVKGKVELTIKKTMYEIAEELQNKLNGLKVNVWENYGKRRIYINKGFNNQVAMLEFDNEDNCLTDLNFGGMDLMGFSQNGIREEMEIIAEVVA